MENTFKVLIVEDENLVARSLKINLLKAGVDVLDMTSNGKSAVKIAIEKNPSLILMDIRLANGLDGIESAEKILMEKKIPIIFMTGYATEKIKERALKLNPVDFLEKPINIYKIKQIIAALKNS